MNAILPLLLAKSTALLAAAWFIHGALARYDPRWRILLWRITGLGAIVVTGMSFCPAPIRIPMLAPSVAGPANGDGASAEREPDPVAARFEPAEGQDGRRALQVDSQTGREQEPIAVKASLPVATVNGARARPPLPPRATDSNVAASDQKANVPHLATAARAVTQFLSLATVASLLWSGGVAAMLLWVAVGLARLRQIRAQAAEAPEPVARAAAEIASALGVGRAFAVKQTAALRTPCLVGIWRPLILLPHEQCALDRRDELAAILAHELAHLKGNDAVFNALLYALSIALWFHPLAWRVRQAHADACDGACDAAAASYLGDVDDYARTLARIAVRLAHREFAVGLAMARSSSIERRIAAVRRRACSARLPRVRAIMATAIFCAAVALLSGSTVSESDAETPGSTPTANGGKENQDAAQPAEAEATAGRVVVHAENAASGEALAGVHLRAHGRIGGHPFNFEVDTDNRGLAEISWPAAEEIQSLWMTATKPNFVALHYVWRSEQQKIEMPARIDLGFQPGQTIGGVVRDEAGRPIAGAELDMTMPVTKPRLANYVFFAASLKTDAAGRWQWSEAPSDLSGVGIRVEHHDYIQGFSSANRGLDNVAVLKQGLQVQGRVVDREGRPIEGAAARLGFDRFGSRDPEAKTAADGTFVLKNCKAGKSLVTVQAEGFSPTFQELTVAEAVEPLQFQLDPGHTLQVQVVDVNGAPIKDAIFATDTWRGFRSLIFRANTDAEGKIVWNGAPPDAMLCGILKSGYMTVRNTPLTAAADAQVVTLHPELEISGTVTDAATGKPIEHFRLRTGLIFSNRDSIHWSRDEATPFEGGRYRVKFSEPYDGHALQVMADGYLPSSSRPFRPEEGAQTFDFALKRGTGPAGVVAQPDGTPAAGAEVALSTKDKRASLHLGRFDRSQNNAEIVNTDAAGRFVFPAQENDEPFLLVIIHEAGFAERLSRELQESKEPIVLEPWGRIEGVVRQGVRPEANREVVFYPERPESRRTHPYLWDYGYRSQTDDQGRFSFDRVMPGRGSAARVVVTEFLGSWQHTPGWQARVEIEPGATTQVAIGGSGRPIVGKIELPKNAEIASDWTANEPASIEAWNKSKKLRAETYARYSANLDRSGRFEIPDVPAGDYKLTVPVNNPPSPNACGAGTAIGRAELEFNVPEMPGGRSDEPLELGEIEATMFDTLDVGEAAPDFVAEELSSGSIRMRELRGKLVLLDFWATSCGPCLAAMPNLKQLQAQFGKSDRFALIGLSCDGEAAAAKRYVEANGLAWRHAHVGGTHSRVPTQYTVRSLPATFLIGPDGRVLAKNLRGDELRQAVAAALADKKLFADATTPAARFPLVRFESSNRKTLADRPAVIVLDNADPGFDKDKPGGDSWRLLSTTGAELSASTGFNCGGSVGGVRRVALDRRRERIYVAENVARRIVACGFDGQKLWQIEQVEADALAVDEKTGNVWSSGGPLLNDGETVVFDPSGNEVAAYPFRAIDLAYDPHDDAFWLAGYEILKLNREGKPLFRKRVDGWCCASVSVNPTDGSVWLAERQHPDIPRSKNRAWLLGADGSVRREVQLGDFHLFAIACAPRTGDAWAAGLGSGLRRISAAGEAGDAMPMRAYSVSVGRESADVWVANDQEVLKLDGAGKVLLRLAHPKPSQDSLLTAF